MKLRQTTVQLGKRAGVINDDDDDDETTMLPNTVKDALSQLLEICM